MTDKKKQGYYFKIIPKEEFPKFIERFKAALEKEENKKGDKKIIDFEIRGTKEDLDGLALEIFSFDESKYDDFIDIIKEEHLKEASYCVSLNINAKTEDGVEEIKRVFEQIKPIFDNIPLFKDNIKFYINNKGTELSIYVVRKQGALVNALMSLGINISEYHKFNIVLKSGINFIEFFDPNPVPDEILYKIFSVIFEIKSETDNFKYIVQALGEALKDVKLSDKNIQEKFDKFVGFLIFINLFIEGKLILEYDANVLTGYTAKDLEKQTGGKEGLKEKILQTQQMAIGMVQSFVIPIVTQFGMIELIKSIDLDYISLSLGVPKYKNGYAISLKLPGLSQVFGELLEKSNSQP